MDRAQARKKAEALVAKMTIEERAGQLKYDAPAIERLGTSRSGTCRYCNGISTGNRLCGHV